MSNFNFPINSRVALKSGVDELYLHAVAGSEGLIRDHRVDGDGFQLILVEWDKDHWRFNGQPDGWTFEAHFQMVDGPQEDEKKDPLYLKKLNAAELSLPGEPEKEEPESAPPEIDPEKFVQELNDAMDDAIDADGFLILTVKKRVNPLNSKEVLFAPSLRTYALTEEASIMLDAQLAQIASSSYHEMAMRYIEILGNIEGGKDYGEM